MKDWYFRSFKPEAIHMSKRIFEENLKIEITNNFDGRYTHDVKLINVNNNEHISKYILYLISNNF